MLWETKRKLQLKSSLLRGTIFFRSKAFPGNLYKEVEAFFKQAQATDWQGIDYSYSGKTEAGHHRIENRQVWAVSIEQLPNVNEAKKWKGLATVVMVKRKRNLWNKRLKFLHHFYTS